MCGSTHCRRSAERPLPGRRRAPRSTCTPMAVICLSRSATADLDRMCAPIRRAEVLSYRASDTRMPSFSFNSLSIRSSPQVAFPATISWINWRRSFEGSGLPVGLDFQSPKQADHFRCHRMRVSGFTFHRASRQANIRLRVAINQRGGSSALRGLTLRS